MSSSDRTDKYWQGGKLSRRGFAGGVLSGASLLLSGGRVLAQAAPATPPTAPRGQAVIGFSQEPTVFNPLLPGLEVDQGVWWNLFDPLWTIDPAGQLVPALAKEIPSVANGGISADGLQWTIRLRDGVKWHDGTPFTAEDVKYTIELIQQPSFHAPSRNGHKFVTDIRVVGPTELTWRMTQPFAPYMSMLAWTFIVPKHVLGKADDPNTAPFNNAPIGTGAFRWGERRTGEHIVLLANPDYYGRGPFLERLVFRYVPDLNVMYTQFRTGDIDYIGLQGIPADHYTEAKKLADRVIYLSPRGAVENITMNLGRPFLADKAVRQALYYAMDKQAIIDALYYGLPNAIESYLPKESWAYDPDLPQHVHDPAKARKLLDAAGWLPGADGIRAKDGVRLEFTNSTTAGNHLREQTQQLLMQDWGKIGVSLKINNMPGAVIWGKFWEESKFDSLMTSTTYTVASDPDVTHRFGSHSIPLKDGSGSNVSQFQDSHVDELLARGIRTTDRAERTALYREVQRIVRGELALLPIFQSVQVEGMKARLKGFQANVNTMTNTWNAAQWYWAS